MLLERDDLLASLHSQLDEAGKGHGSLMLVAGEAGSGKTSLIDAFTGSLDRATLVILGACDPLTTPRPLSPLHDFAADPNSGLEELADRNLSPLERFEIVLHRMKHTIRPILMVVEDIHWADDGTLDFLRFIGRRIGDTKSLMVCTYRDDEVGIEHPLRGVLGQLIPIATTHRLTIEPLSAEAIKVLAGDTPINIGELARITGGNAFYVTEVLGSGAAIPKTVQEAVLARIGRLTAPARRCALTVSIAPRALPIDQAMYLAQVGIEAVDEAVERGVLTSDGSSLRFRHELARAAAEDSLPPARRHALHLGMIELLIENPIRDPAQLAHHAVRADDADLIVSFAPEAAELALARGARREAVEFMSAALQHPEQLGPEQEAEIRLKIAVELRALERPAEAFEQLDIAIPALRSQGRIEELADALGVLQSCLWNLHQFDEGWDAINEAIAILEPLGPSEALALSLERAAHHHMLARRGTRAFEFLERAGTMAEEVGSTRCRWLVLMLTGCVNLVLGDADEGIRQLKKAIREAEAMDNNPFKTLALEMLGSAGGEARRYAEAIAALERGIEHGLATDEDYAVSYHRSWLARIAFEQGRWDEAVEYAELVRATSLDESGIAMITALSALGRVRVRRGDPGGLAVLDEMVELARFHELQHGWNAICGKAEHYWYSENRAAALEDLAPAYERALDTESEWARGEIGFWMWRLGSIDRPPPGTAEPFRLQMIGQWRGAAETWRSIGCPYEVALALADGDAAARLESLEIFDSLGAKPAADRVRSSLREMGIRSVPRGPSRSTRENPFALTTRQLEVLDLMIEGLSNAEIAARLFVTKKTVEHHVSAIYTKLGVRNRFEAIAVAGDHLRENWGRSDAIWG